MPSTLLSYEQIKVAIKQGTKIEVELTREEEIPFKVVKKVDAIVFSLSSSSNFDHDLPNLIEVRVEIDMELIDDHSFKLRLCHFEDSEVISLERDSDDVIHQAHKIDFRPTVLAICYSLIPNGFHLEPLKKVEIDGISVLSEEEYYKTHKKSNNYNPFKDIKSEDF